MERILPGPVLVEEVFADMPNAMLLAEEAALVEKAVPKRRQEFATGRACAHTAIQRLGATDGPILRGERGAPLWPDGVVGTITHCDGYRAAAVARARDVLAVGFDAEPAEALPEGVLEVVADATERAWIADWTAVHPGVHWDRLLFSAKESVYKAWFPLTRRWLDFAGARITADPLRQTFAAELLVPGISAGGHEITGFDGRWMTANGLILTAICVPRLR
jgi:4'-phosphopantetheinyl transferase EntD